MERVKFTCPGDCGNCELLQSGKVRMEICILDQIHQKVQRLETKVDDLSTELGELKTKLEESEMHNLASILEEEKEE